ncbi:hypothetical protein POM88_021174 [Heracleum sosnowskyi]|uniref:Uncharacterized protein n=1 Tax=Heracleum sosnowskyi TaxID=360622 RepID=A0AAD8ICW1_9APIA|nr:hypothetical protein POM88_021174 [Heracleum sosnowskyi]
MASNEEKYDLVREGVVIFTGALAKHLGKDDPKVHAVVEKLLDVINTPSEAVQRAVSACLSPLMQSKQPKWVTCYQAFPYGAGSAPLIPGREQGKTDFSESIKYLVSVFLSLLPDEDAYREIFKCVKQHIGEPSMI